jgi:hypothetical protein
MVFEGLNVTITYVGSPFKDVATLHRHLVLDGGESHAKAVFALLLERPGWSAFPVPLAGLAHNSGWGLSELG